VLSHSVIEHVDSAEAYLEAIVDPNAAVEPKYVGYTAVLKTADVVNGLILGETGNSLNFALADGTERRLLRSTSRKATSRRPCAS